MKKVFVTLLILFGLTSLPVWAQGVKLGWANGDSNLYKKPFTDAEVVTSLPADSKVQIIKRKGGWYQVKADTKLEGWMRMSSLRFGEQPKAGKRSANVQGLKQTIQLFKTGRSGTSGVTVATGIRGLDSADLANSEPDHDALKLLSSYMSDRSTSEKFASKADLQGQNIAFIQLEIPVAEEPEEEAETVKGYWDEE